MSLVDKGIFMFEDNKVELKYLEKGNIVVIINGKPKNILPPARSITLKTRGQAKGYESGTLYDKVPEK